MTISKRSIEKLRSREKSLPEEGFMTIETENSIVVIPTSLPTEESKMSDKRYAKETDLVKVVLLGLGKHFPTTCRAWRNNAGAAMVKDQFVRFGVKGQADISGIMSDGRRLEIECKAEGKKQSKDQIAFMEMIRAHRGLYILAYNFQDVINGLVWGK